jgi:hypothetical protein
MIIRLVIDFGELLKVALKRGNGKKGSEWVKMYEGFWAFCLLFVFGYISVIVVDGVCVRDCKDLGLCKVGIVG